MRARTARRTLICVTLLVLMAAAATMCAPASASGVTHPARDPEHLRTRLLGAPAAPAALAGQLGDPAPTPPLGGVTGMASSAATGLALDGVGAWVAGGATFVLEQTAHILGQTTAPRLGSTWFSDVYWRVAGIASVLTLPFLFAACIQALVRSDLTLLVRAAAGYLPIAMLTMAIAAPLTMLLLAASDQLSGAVSSAAGQNGVHFLARLDVPLGVLSATSGSPFLGFLMALFTVAGALMLWIELLIRQAGVYVIVLMLPVAFAAFVWPARRMWAIRSVELLVALILSKFVIVAVLSLGASALGHSVTDGLSSVLSGVVMLGLGAFAPWALLRLIPLAELASATAGGLRGHAGSGVTALHRADAWAASEKDRWVARAASLRRSADTAKPVSAGEARTDPDPAGGTAAIVKSLQPEDAPSAPDDLRSAADDLGIPPASSIATDDLGSLRASSLATDEPPAGHAPRPDAEWVMTGEAYVHLPPPPVDASGESDT